MPIRNNRTRAATRNLLLAKVHDFPEEALEKVIAYAESLKPPAENGLLNLLEVSGTLYNSERLYPGITALLFPQWLRAPHSLVLPTKDLHGKYGLPLGEALDVVNSYYTALNDLSPDGTYVDRVLGEILRGRKDG